jgi:hypothetical protein
MTQNADYERVTFSVTVQVAKGTNLNELGERLFDFLGADPDDLFPEIAEIEIYDVHIDSSGAEEA